MPEGPSILIAKDVLTPLIKGKVILAATGNAKVDLGSLEKQKVVNVLSWGKHLLICLPNCTIKIHFLMFGSYSIDEQTKKDRSVRLRLSFKKRTVYFYTCSVRLITTDLDSVYDWETDVLSDQWQLKLPFL